MTIPQSVEYKRQTGQIDEVAGKQALGWSVKLGAGTPQDN